MQRHAEIAGGGIAGLAAGMMLARAGWSVRVHERSPEIRESGAGIYLRNNSLDVLEEYGLFDRLVVQGTRLERSLSIDRDGTVRQNVPVPKTQRLYVTPRQALVDVLAYGAHEAGVEIALNSEAVAATPEGELIMADGRRHRADLIVAADGFNSKIRDSLNLGATHRELDTAVNRHFIPNRIIAERPESIQYWSGNRRIGVSPSGPNHTYVFTAFPNRDRGAKVLPIDVEDWGRAFPLLRDQLPVLAAAPVTQYRYVLVDCPRWSSGRVAIIGDAAHGLPPTLGQGAGLAIMNAKALTVALSEQADPRRALPYWEQCVRFISDQTQAWSCRYDWFTRGWPTQLEFLRPVIFWAFNNFPSLTERMRVADRGLSLTALDPNARLAG